MVMKVREAGERDFPELTELFREFAEFEKSPEKMVNSSARMIKEQDYFTCFLALDGDDRITGYAACFFSYHTWSGKSLYMDDLYVKPEYRKQGIGKLLLEKVIDFAKKEDCSRVKWQVSNWNKNGQEFYRRMGAAIDHVQLNCEITLR